jgi:hypothetical protein
VDTDKNLTAIEVRTGRIEDQLRAQAGHLAELHQCLVRLQAQVVALERGGQCDAGAEFYAAVVEELSRRGAKVVPPGEG